MKPLFAILVVLSLLSCTRNVYVPVERKTTEHVFLRDTIVQTRLDVIRDSSSVRDTVSFLENKYAESSAHWSGGMLNHSLHIKPVTIPVKVQYVEKVRVDSIPVPYPEPYPVEKALSRWQKTRMTIGDVALIALAILILGWIARKIK